MWTHEKPTEPGYYWFYGDIWDVEYDPEIHCVEVFQSRNSLVFSCKGLTFFVEHETLVPSTT